MLAGMASPLLYSLAAVERREPAADHAGAQARVKRVKEVSDDRASRYEKWSLQMAFCRSGGPGRLHAAPRDCPGGWSERSDSPDSSHSTLSASSPPGCGPGIASVPGPS